MRPESTLRVRPAGRFVSRNVPCVLAWAFAAGCIAGVFLRTQNVAKALAFGLCAASPALILVTVRAVRIFRGSAAEPSTRSGKAFLWGWLGSSLIVSSLVLIFERLLFFLWFANPLSGTLMFGVMTFGLDENMYIAGLFDLWTWHAVLAIPLFMVFLGWIFVPFLIHEGVGLRDAFHRSWRMVTGARLSLFRLALKTLWLPTLLAWAGLYCTVIPFWIPTVEGVHVYLWIAAGVLLSVAFGPWFTTSLAAAYVSLRVEDDEDERIAERHRSEQWFRREENDRSGSREQV